MGVWTFVFALILDLVLLAHAVYEVVLLSDVSADFLNPVDAVNRINPYVLPSMALQGFITLLMLVTGNWWTLLFNLPLAVWNGSKYEHLFWLCGMASDDAGYSKRTMHLMRQRSSGRCQEIRCSATSDSQRTCCSFSGMKTGCVYKTADLQVPIPDDLCYCDGRALVL
jgi:hypothetical protein